MKRVAAATLCIIIGCGASGDDPNNASVNNTNNQNNLGNVGNVSTANNQNNASEGVSIYAPDECKADIEILRTEDFEVRDHPLAYKGDFFGYRGVPVEAQLVSLVTDSILVAAGDSVPSSPDELMSVFGGRFAVARDSGMANEADYPVAFSTDAVDSSSPDIVPPERNVLVYSDGAGGLAYGFGGGETASHPRLGDVTIERVEEIQMNDSGSVFALANVEDFEDRVILRQDGPGNTPIVIAYEGYDLATGGAGLRFIDSIDDWWPTDFNDVIVRATIRDGAGERGGFAYLLFDPALMEGSQCIATNTAILCGGILVNNTETLEPTEIGTDGATTGAWVTGSGDGVFRYRIQGPNDGRGEVRLRDEIIPGYILENVERSEVCTKENALYFVAELRSEGNVVVEELMRIDESGEFQLLTNFRSLVGAPGYDGQVPDDIRNFRLGYNCDAVLYTYGPSGETDAPYEGYWGVYRDGDVLEIFDEGDGNPTVVPTARSRSGLDPNSDDHAVVHIGPNGELYFVIVTGDRAAQRRWNYAVATKPDSCP